MTSGLLASEKCAALESLRALAKASGLLLSPYLHDACRILLCLLGHRQEEVLTETCLTLVELMLWDHIHHHNVRYLF